MKAYNKPEFYVEEFVLNDVVAVCDRLPTGEYEYQATTVNCLKTSSDIIFTDSTTGCDHKVDPNANGDGYAWYEDTDTTNDIPDDLYFGWFGPQGSGGGSSANNALFDKLKDIFDGLLKQQPGRGQVIHIGVANDYLKQLYSHS